MKRISVILTMLALGWAIWAWAGTTMVTHTYTKKLVDGATDRAIQETLGVVSTDNFRNRVLGRIYFDSTQYDTGAFGNADTVIMVLKSLSGDVYTTLDSVFKVAALGLGVNCTLNVNEGRDTLFGTSLVLIYRFADTLDAGVAATAGDTCKLNIKFNFLHGYQN